MKKVRAKKFLGQHFLLDEDIAYRIAHGVCKGDLPILEVGPGMGVLSKYLREMGRELKVAEIDRESIAYLREHYPDLTIWEGDFLELDLHTVFDGSPFVVIGNYPYNISTQIFFHILEYKDLVPVCGGMLQKEVARRLASPPGSKEYGILSVFLQTWYEVTYLFSVGPEVFLPPPKVHSGVIRLERNERKSIPCKEALFRRLVKATFGKRRKTLRNSLKAVLPPDFDGLGDKVYDKRPEQLGPDEFIALTLELQAYMEEAAGDK